MGQTRYEGGASLSPHSLISSIGATFLFVLLTILLMLGLCAIALFHASILATVPTLHVSVRKRDNAKNCATVR